jgi:hypothetical protein
VILPDLIEYLAACLTTCGFSAGGLNCGQLDTKSGSDARGHGHCCFLLIFRTPVLDGHIHELCDLGFRLRNLFEAGHLNPPSRYCDTQVIA